MGVARHKRQIILFLIAIVVPAAVLIVLASRIMVQDRELATKRISDQRLAAVSQLHRELTARLETIKLQEINRLIRPPGQPQDPGNPAVVFTAALDGDQLVLPWEVSPPPDSAEFARHRQEGEIEEFSKRNNAAAAAAYRLALAAARSPLESAEARLALARALSNAGGAEEASRVYQSLLNDSSGARDDQGVGFSFYAAAGLLKMKRDSDTVSNFVRKEVDGETRLTLPELYMARDLFRNGTTEPVAAGSPPIRSPEGGRSGPVPLSRNGTSEPVAAGSPPIRSPEEGRSGPVPLSRNGTSEPVAAGSPPIRSPEGGRSGPVPLSRNGTTEPVAAGSPPIRSPAGGRSGPVPLSRNGTSEPVAAGSPPIRSPEEGRSGPVPLSRNGTTEPVAAGSPPIRSPEEGRSGPVPLSRNGTSEPVAAGSPPIRSPEEGRSGPVPPLGTNARISARIAQMEQGVALTKDLPRLRAQMESGAAWVPYGPHNDDPWLVAIAPPAPPFPGLVLAVSSVKVAPPGAKLTAHLSDGAASGEPLGDDFPGLHVQWPDNRFLENTLQGVPLAVWIAGLALVLGIAVFGGYLLLRDVHRDIRMTEVRAQFIASVSHELKTPLTAIRMFAETLALGRSRDDRTKAEYLETIVNESERLARLVDNVLDFSKIEQGKKIYRLRPTRLEDVAGSAIRAMQFPLAQGGFKLHLAVQEGMPVLQADPDAIEQAMLNLLTNAMKYSGDAREIDLRVGLRGGARNGDAVIEVADHGLGLAPDEQKHVFEKFYRAPSHESRLIAGTGLGLTLVEHIAKAHGGRVEVESAPGAGSTFSILLPLQTENGVHA